VRDGKVEVRLVHAWPRWGASGAGRCPPGGAERGSSARGTLVAFLMLSERRVVLAVNRAARRVRVGHRPDLATTHPAMGLPRDPVANHLVGDGWSHTLPAATEWADFQFLRDSAGLSDSALSKQLTTLEDAGYIEVR